ncbi:MAG: aminoglycoside phosphotransferase family protein [Acidimicrobiia bacterium]|nr:aminoglycoside phosphotransferase family protein [Acidimicrobiia bacterium]
MTGVFAAGDAVLRVSRATAPLAVAIARARVLAAAGVRVPRPLADDVVMTDDGLQVTAWERVAIHGAPVDWVAVGSMVAAVHRLDLAATGPLPFAWDFPWWDGAALLERTADLVDPVASAALHRAWEADRWWRHGAERDLVVCHGDVHPGNVLAAVDGPVILDWDLVCLAPAGWDHAPLLTWEARWGGDPGIYPDFATGYGASLADDPTTVALARLRLLAATLMRLEAGRDDEEAAAEAQRRLRWWRGDPDAPVWRPM